MVRLADRRTSRATPAGRARGGGLPSPPSLRASPATHFSRARARAAQRGLIVHPRAFRRVGIVPRLPVFSRTGSFVLFLSLSAMAPLARQGRLVLFRSLKQFSRDTMGSQRGPTLCYTAGGRLSKHTGATTRLGDSLSEGVYDRSSVHDPREDLRLRTIRELNNVPPRDLGAFQPLGNSMSGALLVASALIGVDEKRGRGWALGERPGGWGVGERRGSGRDSWRARRRGRDGARAPMRHHPKGGAGRRGREPGRECPAGAWSGGCCLRG